MIHSIDFKVRRANSEDIPIIVDFTIQEAIESEGLNPNVSTVRRGVETAFESEWIAAYWVLEHLGSARIVGSVSVVEEWSDWNAAPYWFIQSIYVLPEFRGRNLMKFMLDKVRREARDKGVIELRLYVHKKNRRAINAFLLYGFQLEPYQLMSKRLAKERTDR